MILGYSLHHVVVDNGETYEEWNDFPYECFRLGPEVGKFVFPFRHKHDQEGLGKSLVVR